MRTIVCKSLVPLLLCIVCIGCGGSNDSNDAEYVALGASDATGIGADPLTNGYVFQIHDYLDSGNKSWELINLGIPAAEADQIVDSSLEVATRVGPELVTLWLGANDIVAGRNPNSFADDLTEIFEDLRSETGAFLFIATIPDLTTLPRFQENPNPNVTITRVQAYNEIIRALASQYNATVVDLFAVNFDESVVSDDGFHPSNQGHELIAQLFIDAIRASSAEESVE